MKKGIAILGSTGSVGTQALQLIAESSDIFKVILLSCHKNVSLLLQQIEQFKPDFVVITDQNSYKRVLLGNRNESTKVLYGEKALLEAIQNPDIQIVLNAMVGVAGLLPLIESIKQKKMILLANKESLVVAGEYIMPLAREFDIKILPIDSEHSAIFQCLLGENENSVEKVILTASGGPFLDFPIEDFKNIRPAQALNHPVWKMGKKVSVDSATMMNKGLEAIEAVWLFNLKPSQVEVIIHPQSIIHSFVKFNDGNLKAQLSSPNMRFPIQYALHFPNRINTISQDFSFTNFGGLTFREADRKKFRNLALAFYAMEKGGNMPAVLNAANEIAVQAFLDGKLSFNQISEVNEEMINQQAFISKPELENYFETTKKCFADTEAYISKHT